MHHNIERRKWGQIRDLTCAEVYRQGVEVSWRVLRFHLQCRFVHAFFLVGGRIVATSATARTKLTTKQGGRGRGLAASSKLPLQPPPRKPYLVLDGVRTPVHCPLSSERAHATQELIKDAAKAEPVHALVVRYTPASGISKTHLWGPIWMNCGMGDLHIIEPQIHQVIVPNLIRKAHIATGIMYSIIEQGASETGADHASIPW